jgi:hypothetical protein
MCSVILEMTKIMISNQSHKCYRKYDSENWRLRTYEYIRGGMRCHGGVSIPCQPVTPTVIPISTFDKRYNPMCPISKTHLNTKQM